MLKRNCKERSLSHFRCHVVMSARKRNNLTLCSIDLILSWNLRLRTQILSGYMNFPGCTNLLKLYGTRQCEFKVSDKSKKILPVWRAKISFYHSKANLNVKIYCGKITNLKASKTRQMSARGMYRNENSTFHSAL